MCPAHASAGVVFFVVGVYDQVAALTKVGGDGEGQINETYRIEFGNRSAAMYKVKKR